MLRQGIAQDIMKEAGGALTAVFSSIQQNPTVKNTDDCARMLREEGADFAVAIGEAVSSIARKLLPASRRRHTARLRFWQKHKRLCNRAFR